MSDMATSRPSAAAAVRTSPTSSTTEGLPTLAMIASRRRSGTSFAQELEPLAGEVGRLVRQAGDVSAWPRKAGNQAVGHRVARDREDDRDGGGRLLRRKDCRRALRQDDIDLVTDELRHDLGERPLLPSAQRYSIATLRPS